MRKTRMGLALLVAWALSMVLSYFVVQQLAFAPVLLALGRSLIDILAVAAVIVLAGAIGTLIMPDLARQSDLLREALRALLGLGLLSLVVLVVGLAGLFPSRWLAWLITVSLIVVLYRQAIAWMRQIRDCLRLPFAYTPDRFTLWMQRLVLVLLGMAFIAALTPPTAWDALTYHLEGPRLYLDAGQIVSFPENHFLSFPQLVEMLYLWLMILARPQAAAILHWCFGVLALALLIGLARRLRRPTAGWLAAALLLAAFSFWNEFAWPYNDLATTAYILAATVILLGALEVRPSHRRSLFIWVGIFTGLAMGAKYTAAGATIGIAALVIWITRRDGPAAMIRALGTVAGVALIAFAPWLIKNMLLDGNPIAPFGPGTVAFDELDQWYYLRPGTGLESWALPIAPVQASVFGQEGRAPYGAAIGPLLVALLPSVLFGWRRRSAHIRAVMGALAVMVFPAYVIWLIGVATTWFLIQTRLLFPIFPALALIAALGIDGLGEQREAVDMVRVLRWVIAVVSLLSFVQIGTEVVALAPLRVIAGLESEDDFLLRRLGAHYAAVRDLGELPDEARVLGLWEPRSYYCRTDCVPDSMIDEWWHDREITPDPADIAAQWRQEGITHVLIFESGMRFLYEEEQYDPLDDEDIAALDELRDQMTLLWAIGDGYSLYALDQGATP